MRKKKKVAVDGPMANISIDNGFTSISPEKAIRVKPWDVIVNYMDDDIRERVHAELAPCTELEFLTRYLELSLDDLIIG